MMSFVLPPNKVWRETFKFAIIMHPVDLDEYPTSHVRNQVSERPRDHSRPHSQVGEQETQGLLLSPLTGLKCQKQNYFVQAHA